MKPQVLFLRPIAFSQFILAMSFAITLLFLPNIVSCQCSTPAEVGNWVNRDASTSSITHVQVDFVCQDQVLNGQPYPPGPPFYMHLWGKCSPGDCDWGRIGANPVTISGTQWIYGFYDHGFAKRYVYIKPSSLYPGNLYMWMYTDFTDPGRPDYISTNWFHH